jgi:hypothetical protein
VTNLVAMTSNVPTQHLGLGEQLRGGNWQLTGPVRGVHPGRVTGTRRPARVTEPSSLPCPTADRAGACFPFGPHAAATSAFIIAAITCGPVPTAIASRPSCTSPVSSAIVTLTASGSTGVVAVPARIRDVDVVDRVAGDSV